MDEIHQRVTEYINKSDVQESSQWFIEFIQNPEALDILIDVIPSFKGNIHRLFLIIQLQHCIDYHWNGLEIEAKSEIFSKLLQLVRNEPDSVNRENLLFAIQKTFSHELFQILISFISEIASSGAPTDLGLALMLTSQVCECESISRLSELVMSLLDAGFSSDNLEVRLAAFCFILNTRIPVELEDKIPIYWEQILEIFEPSFNSPNFSQISQYFYYACSSAFKYRLNVVPLLNICLSLARSQTEDAYKLLSVMRIIENMCINYTEEVLQSDMISDVIEVFVLVSNLLFQPDDTLSMTQANCFERSFSELCKQPEVLEYLYSFFDELETTNSSHFVIVRSFAVMFKDCKEFFLDKLSDVASVLDGGIGSDSLLLVEASVSATDIFLECFASEDAETTLQLASDVLEVTSESPNVDLVLAFAHILEVSKLTDELFDQTFEVAIYIISNGEPVLQQAALTCLITLAQYSYMKISVRLEEFTSVMFEILGQPDEAVELLKPQAVECLHIVANNIGSEFDPYAPTFLEYIVSNLESEGVELALTCFSALELMVERYPESLSDVIDTIIQTAVSKASYDATPKLKAAVSNNLTGDYDIEEFAPVFQESACALRLLSTMTKIPELREMLRKHTLQCCMYQSYSCNTDCRTAAAYAISNLADAIVSPEEEPPLNETTQMGYVLLTLIPAPDDAAISSDGGEADIAEEAFISAAHVVDVLEYHAFGICIQQFLERARSYFLFVLDDRTAIQPLKETLTAISQFIEKVAASAGRMAPTLLQQFIALTPDLVSSGESELRTIALKFVSDIVSASSDGVDEDFKRSGMEVALETADQEGVYDKYAFVCIRVIANSDPELAESVIEDVYRICMEMLESPEMKTDRYYMARDNCVVTLGDFLMNVIGDRVDYHEYIQACLSSLPLIMDCEISEDAVNFFFWLFAKGGEEYIADFLKVLIVTFGMPPHTFERMNFSTTTKRRMRELCVNILSRYSNQDEIVATYLDGDQDRIQYLTNALQATD